jgi:single-strand DNA-binding protein
MTIFPFPFLLREFANQRFLQAWQSVAEHVSKGSMVMVAGRIHYTKWTDQNSTDRYGCEIIAEQVDFFAKAKETTNDEPKKRRSK